MEIFDRVLLGYAVCEPIFFAMTTKGRYEKDRYGRSGLCVESPTNWMVMRGIQTADVRLLELRDVRLSSWGLLFPQSCISLVSRTALKAFILPIVLVLAAIEAIYPE